MKKDALVILFCILSTTIFSQTNISVAAAQDTICQGESVGLNATGDTFDQYTWTPSTWITNISTTNPTVTPPTTTTYTLTATSLGNSIITNGDFSLGNVGFETEYTYGPNTAGGQWGDLSSEGTYTVVTNPNDGHTNFANCDDHTTGFGNMLVVNGSATANQAIWCQNVSVMQNTSYEFSTWVTTVVSGNLAQLQFSINGQLLGSTFSAPSGTCNWQQFFEVWESGSSTNVEICIVNQNIALGGNDFALDDISFSPILVATDSVTVYVSDISGVIATQTTTSCNGDLATASVAVNGGFMPYTYAWNNGQTTETATDLTEGVHTVVVTDAVGCATVVNVTIEAPANPVIDTVEVNHTTCGFENASLEIFPGAGQAPFQYSINGTDFQNETTFESVAAGTFFAVIEDANGCTGAFQVTVNPSEVITFEIETPHGADLCDESLPVLLDAGDFETYEWSTGETTSIIQPTEGGDYSVNVTDIDGCEASASILLEDCGSWAMPNVFTPDGDGVNDTFGPVIEDNAATILDFKIYNRWGNIVHDERTAWDGEVDGNPHPMDVLVYFIRLETKDGVVEERGDVSLIR